MSQERPTAQKKSIVGVTLIKTLRKPMGLVAMDFMQPTSTVLQWVSLQRIDARYLTVLFDVDTLIIGPGYPQSLNLARSCAFINPRLSI